MTTTSRIEGLEAALAIKAPVRVATTANITLSGLQTIDGVAVLEDNRVLVKNQTIGSQNGIYIATTGEWSRAADWNGARDAVKGTRISVTDGATNGNKIFYVTTNNPIVIGTTTVVFAAEDSSAFDAISPIDALGEIIYGDSVGSSVALSGNITTTKKFLTQTGDGSNSAAPAWNTIIVSDLPTVTIAKGGTGETVKAAAFDALAPSTTKGDLIVHNGTDNIRVGVGADGAVLVASSASASGVAWDTIAGGSSVFNDSLFRIQDEIDGTKRLGFQVSGISTGATRILTPPNQNDTIVGTTATQTLTNKTLTAPVISTISNSGTITLPTSTTTLVGRNTTDTLTNKTLTSPTVTGGTVNASVVRVSGVDVLTDSDNVITNPYEERLEVKINNYNTNPSVIAYDINNGGLGFSTGGMWSTGSGGVIYQLLSIAEANGTLHDVAGFGAKGIASTNNSDVWGGTCVGIIGNNLTGCSAHGLEVGIINQGASSNNTYGLVIVGDGNLSNATTNKAAIQIQVQRALPSGTGQFEKGIVFNPFPQQMVTSTGTLIECLSGNYRNGIDFGACAFVGGYVLKSAAFNLENAGAIDYKSQSDNDWLTVKINGTERKAPLYDISATSKPIGAGSTAINDLSDVIITSPVSGQVISYNGSNWVNATVAGAFGGDFADLGEVTITTSGAFDVRRFAIDSNHRLQFEHTVNTPSSFASINLVRNNQSSGGVGVSTGIRVDCTAGAAVQSNEWALCSVLENYATFNGGGGGGGAENCAAYFQANHYRAYSSWGLAVEAKDMLVSGVASGIVWGIENLLVTDRQNVRSDLIVQTFLQRNFGTGATGRIYAYGLADCAANQPTQNTAQYGFLVGDKENRLAFFGGLRPTVNNGFAVYANGITGFQDEGNKVTGLLLAGSYSGAAISIPANNSISFENSNAVRLGYSTGTLALEATRPIIANGSGLQACFQGAGSAQWGIEFSNTSLSSGVLNSQGFAIRNGGLLDFKAAQANGYFTNGNTRFFNGQAWAGRFLQVTGDFGTGYLAIYV